MRQPIDNCVRNMGSDENVVERRQLVEEFHAPARKNFPQRRIIVRGYNNLWQADIIEMHPYSTVTITTYLSMCWASTHESYYSRIKMKSRRLTLSPR